MEEAEKELALRCYGYGRWDAPYWFIGPEQGQARWEKNDLNDRFDAFRRLNCDGLTDCRAFHALIRENRWHRKMSPAALQPTWKFLILTLKAFLGEEFDEENRRAYQRDDWGTSAGQTCVIELSGLPATSFRVDRQRELFRKQRLEFINVKMLSLQPRFVIIYGKSQHLHWRRFWEDNRIAALQFSDIAKLPFTTVAFAPQPTAPGSSNQYWISLGQRLRQECDQESLSA